MNRTNYIKDPTKFTVKGECLYHIASVKFSNKENIIKYCRSVLSQYKDGDKITYAVYVDFIQELYTYHERYDESKTFVEYVNVKLNRDNESEWAKYTNFEVVFTDGSKETFSNRKAIDNMERTYNKYQRRFYRRNFL